MFFFVHTATGPGGKRASQNLLYNTVLRKRSPGQSTQVARSLDVSSEGQELAGMEIRETPNQNPIPHRLTQLRLRIPIFVR